VDDYLLTDEDEMKIRAVPAGFLQPLLASITALRASIIVGYKQVESYVEEKKEKIERS
jgi:hypothetical protein